MMVGGSESAVDAADKNPEGVSMCVGAADNAEEVADLNVDVVLMTFGGSDSAEDTGEGRSSSVPRVADRGFCSSAPVLCAIAWPPLS